VGSGFAWHPLIVRGVHASLVFPASHYVEQAVALPRQSFPETEDTPSEAIRWHDACRRRCPASKATQRRILFRHRSPLSGFRSCTEPATAAWPESCTRRTRHGEAAGQVSFVLGRDRAGARSARRSRARRAPSARLPHRVVSHVCLGAQLQLPCNFAGKFDWLCLPEQHPSHAKCLETGSRITYARTYYIFSRRRDDEFMGLATCRSLSYKKK
jgi:hypothetical protein